MAEHPNQLLTDREVLNKKNEVVCQRQIYTDREASEFLRISQISLWRLRKKRAITFRRVCGKIAYTLDDLNQYLESTKQEAQNV